MMSIFCWKQLKCFHVGRCLGQEKHSISQHFQERHWSIFIDCFDRKKKKKKNERRIFVSYNASESSQNSYAFVYDFLFFFPIIPLEHSLVKFPTVHSFSSLQHDKNVSLTTR